MVWNSDFLRFGNPFCPSLIGVGRTTQAGDRTVTQLIPGTTRLVGLGSRVPREPRAAGGVPPGDVGRSVLQPDTGHGQWKNRVTREVVAGQGASALTAIHERRLGDFGTRPRRAPLHAPGDVVHLGVGEVEAEAVTRHLLRRLRHLDLEGVGLQELGTTRRVRRRDDGVRADSGIVPVAVVGRARVGAEGGATHLELDAGDRAGRTVEGRIQIDRVAHNNEQRVRRERTVASALRIDRHRRRLGLTVVAGHAESRGRGDVAHDDRTVTRLGHPGAELATGERTRRGVRAPRAGAAAAGGDAVGAAAEVQERRGQRAVVIHDRHRRRGRRTHDEVGLRTDSEDQGLLALVDRVVERDHHDGGLGLTGGDEDVPLREPHVVRAAGRTAEVELDLELRIERAVAPLELHGARVAVLVGARIGRLDGDRTLRRGGVDTSVGRLVDDRAVLDHAGRHHHTQTHEELLHRTDLSLRGWPQRPVTGRCGPGVVGDGV